MKEWMDLYDCQGRVKGLTHTTTQALRTETST